MPKLIVVCKDCGGSGIYQGMCEPPGYGAVCRVCKGHGGVEIDFEPFTERKILEGIDRVVWGVSLRGRKIEDGDTITYGEFLEGKRPPTESVSEEREIDRLW